MELVTGLGSLMASIYSGIAIGYFNTYYFLSSLSQPLVEHPDVGGSLFDCSLMVWPFLMHDRICNQVHKLSLYYLLPNVHWVPL